MIKSKLPKFSQLELQVIKPFQCCAAAGSPHPGRYQATHLAGGLHSEPGWPRSGLLPGHMPKAARDPVADSTEVEVQNSLLALGLPQLSLHYLQTNYASQFPFIVMLSGISEMLVVVIEVSSIAACSSSLRLLGQALVIPSPCSPFTVPQFLCTKSL